MLYFINVILYICDIIYMLYCIYVILYICVYVFLYTLTGRTGWGHFVWQYQWVNKTPGEYVGIVCFIVFLCHLLE